MKHFTLPFLLIANMVFAQSGKVVELRIEGTEIAHGEIKVSEILVTHEGEKLSPGSYRIGTVLTPRGQTVFVLSKFQVDRLQPSDVHSGTVLNPSKQVAEEIFLDAEVVKNSLVKGLASLKGEFKVQPFSPTETIISFSSKQFEAKTTVGRLADSQMIDVFPSSLALEERVECGPNCTEAYPVVSIKNVGNSVAAGKWNVALVEPNVYLGTFENLAPDAEAKIRAANKVKLRCCGPLTLQVKVYPDFYNKLGIDSNESNNTQQFTIKTQ